MWNIFIRSEISPIKSENGLVYELQHVIYVTSLIRALILETRSTCRYMSKKSKKDGKDQESIQLSTTSDPGYHMGK